MISFTLVTFAFTLSFWAILSLGLSFGFALLLTFFNTINFHRGQTSVGNIDIWPVDKMHSSL